MPPEVFLSAEKISYWWYQPHCQRTYLRTIKYFRARAHEYVSRYAWHLVSRLWKSGIWERAKYQVRVLVCTQVPSWTNFTKYNARKQFWKIIVKLARNFSTATGQFQQVLDSFRHFSIVFVSFRRISKTIENCPKLSKAVASTLFNSFW